MRPLLRALALSALAVTACGGDDGGTPMVTTPDTAVPLPTPDAGTVPDADEVVMGPTSPPDTGMGPSFCTLGKSAPIPKVPAGFCAREFAEVKHPRAIAFAPNGDLFVSAPSDIYVTRTGGGIGGVLVLSDDDRDGKAEIHEFLKGVNDIHGIAVGGGYLWYTTRKSIFRTPYQPGQRAETPGKREDMHLPAGYAGERSTHPLARSQAGHLYSSRSVAPVCAQTLSGEIYEVSDAGALGLIAKGFRNPMYIRCHYKDEVCAATELGDDGAPGEAREKLLFLTAGSDYGYPTCHRPGVAKCGGTCQSTTRAELDIPLGDTPFGLDWERGLWPAPYTNGIFMGLHGSFYDQYKGAGVTFVPADPTTHRPTGEPTLFVKGFGDPNVTLERPADVAFSYDGRLFFATDQGNKIYWIAPETLRM